DRRLLGPDLLAGYDEDAVLMRVAVDSASARTVGVGDVVSVLGAGDSQEYLATRVRVAMGDSQAEGQAKAGAFGESLVGLIVPRGQAPQLARNAQAGLTLVLEHRQ